MDVTQMRRVMRLTLLTPEVVERLVGSPDAVLEKSTAPSPTPGACARATRVSALHSAPALACGRFFCDRLSLGSHRYRICQPQPIASKPAPAKEIVSITLA